MKFSMVAVAFPVPNPRMTTVIAKKRDICMVEVVLVVVLVKSE